MTCASSVFRTILLTLGLLNLFSQVAGANDSEIEYSKRPCTVTYQRSEGGYEYVGRYSNDGHGHTRTDQISGPKECPIRVPSTFDSFAMEDMGRSSNPFGGQYYIDDFPKSEHFVIDKNTHDLVDSLPIDSSPSFIRDEKWFSNSQLRPKSLGTKTIKGRLCKGWTLGIKGINPWVAEFWYDTETGALAYATADDTLMKPGRVWVERMISYSDKPLPAAQFKVPIHSEQFVTDKCEFSTVERLKPNMQGLVDHKGKIFICPNAEGVSGFSEGLAAATKRLSIESRSGRSGYLNTKGFWAIKPKFEMAENFSNGLASVCVDGKWGYIDKKGDVVIKPQFLTAGDFHDGLALACIEMSGKNGERCGKWGFIDKTGAFVIAPTFDSALHFSDGLAAVLVKDKYGFIDSSGKLVIAPKFLQADFFSEGLCLVLLDNHNEAYIDKTGEKAFPQEFRHLEGAGMFNERISTIISDCKGSDLSSGIVQKESRPVADIDSARFHHGIALVQGDPWSGERYIDRDGKPAKATRDVINSQFSEGLKPDSGMFGQQQLYGYVNQSGQVVIPYQFGGAAMFSNGFAVVNGAPLPIEKPFLQKPVEATKEQRDSLKVTAHSLLTKIEDAPSNKRPGLVEEYVAAITQAGGRPDFPELARFGALLKKDPIVSETVIGYLSGTNEREKQQAISLLYETAVAWLYRRQENPYLPSEPMKAECAMSIPDRCMPALIRSYRNDEAPVRNSLGPVLICVHLEHPEVKKILIESLKNDEDKNVRRTTAEWLGEIGRDEGAACGDTLTVLSDAIMNDESVRDPACLGIARMGKYAVAALPALRVALHDNFYLAPVRACAALTKLGPAAAPAVPDLMWVLENYNPPPNTVSLLRWGLEFVGEALAATGAAGQMQIPKLQQMLHGEHKLAALIALECMGSAADVARPDITPLLNDPDPTIRSIAESTLNHRKSFVR